MSKEPSAAERFDRWIAAQEEMRPYRDAEDRMILNHAPDCYGTWGKCISCGCVKSRLIACPSHHNDPSYLADVIKAQMAHATPPTR